MNVNESKLYLKMIRLANMLKENELNDELKEKILKGMEDMKDYFQDLVAEPKTPFVVKEEYVDYGNFEYNTYNRFFDDYESAVKYMQAKVELEKEYYFEKGYTEDELEENGWFYEDDVLIKTEEYCSKFEIYQAVPLKEHEVKKEIDELNARADDLRENNGYSHDDGLDR